MTHLAMAFAIAHPGVTSAIIGPRTMEHLDDLLAGVDVTLTDEILDRIDEIVPPGTDVGAARPGLRAPGPRRAESAPPTRRRTRRRLSSARQHDLDRRHDLLRLGPMRGRNRAATVPVRREPGRCHAADATRPASV